MAIPTSVATISAAGTNAATATKLPALGPLATFLVNGGTGGVLMPPGVYANVPLAFTIWNNLGVSIVIYPGTGGTISTTGATGAASYTLAANTVVTFWNFSPVGDWVVH